MRSIFDGARKAIVKYIKRKYKTLEKEHHRQFS